MLPRIVDEGRAFTGEQFTGDRVDEAGEEGVLVAKVVVDECLADAGVGRHVVECERGGSIRGYPMRSRIEDPLRRAARAGRG